MYISPLSTFMHATRYSTAIQKINHPIHKGVPNPKHGMFFFVGSIPANCYDQSRNNGQGGSKFYATENEAIQAAIEGGADYIQRADCSKVDIASFKA